MKIFSFDLNFYNFIRKVHSGVGQAHVNSSFLFFSELLLFIIVEFQKNVHFCGRTQLNVFL